MDARLILQDSAAIVLRYRLPILCWQIAGRLMRPSGKARTDDRAVLRRKGRILATRRPRSQKQIAEVAARATG